MKVLIIRFSSIGDIVLTTPVIRCIKQQTGAEVHYITKKSFYDVLKNNPYIDKLHLLDDNLKECIHLLKKEKFDYIIDLHHNLRSWRLKFALGIKSSSFNKLNIEKWLAVNFKKDILPHIHIVDRYINTAKSLGIVNDEKGLDYFISEKENVPIDILPESHRQGYIGFAIGAQHATKRLPPEKLLELCSLITQPILLLGGQEDHETASFIVKKLGDRIYNACGKYTINQSASLVQQARKIITHDTGLMHIAAAFNKEIISVWGNTIPEFGMSPYKVSEQHIFEVKNLSCRPCSKIGYQKCPKGHFKCMNLHNLKEIATIVNNV